MKNIIINAKRIIKIYGDSDEKFMALQEIDLEIYKGDFAVIMGSSGSGKSTLLYALSGLDGFNSGEVFFLDKSISRLDDKEMSIFRRKNIGFVFQGIHLIPNLTLLDNVLVTGFLGSKNKKMVIEKAKELLEKVGLAKQMNRYPSQVSGGQQQRAAIARALINSPSVLFADEPTGALNSSSGKEILDLLTKLNMEGQTIVMVTHDLKAAIRSNRVIMISDGKAISDIELDFYKEEKKIERENKLHEQLIGMGW